VLDFVGQELHFVASHFLLGPLSVEFGFLSLNLVPLCLEFALLSFAFRILPLGVFEGFLLFEDALDFEVDVGLVGDKCVVVRVLGHPLGVLLLPVFAFPEVERVDGAEALALL